MHDSSVSSMQVNPDLVEPIKEPRIESQISQGVHKVRFIGLHEEAKIEKVHPQAFSAHSEKEKGVTCENKVEPRANSRDKKNIVETNE